MTSLLVALWAAVTVAPAQSPDSTARGRLADALATLQDSLDAVRGAAAGFRIDLAAASSALLLQRSQRLHASCRGAAHAAAGLPFLPPASLRRELAALRAALAGCERDYDTTDWAARADTVRAWAPYRLRRLDEALRRYSEAAAPARKALRPR